MAFLMRSKRIGVLELRGAIGRSVKPEQHLPLLERAKKSGAIGALVLVVDSPGGSASASEELYLGAARVAESKPVVAYITGLGASGALYVSAAAHRIVAVRGSIIGSIGVIFSRLVAQDALQRLGLGFAVAKTGPHKDMFGPWRAPTEEEERKVDAMIDDMYQRFLQVVSEGRKIDLAKVREIATGEVFSAERAQALGLVDELGDLDRALDIAAEMAGIKRRTVALRPRRRFFPLMRPPWGREAADAIMEELEAAAVGRLSM